MYDVVILKGAGKDGARGMEKTNRNSDEARKL